jgi:hypothetical protein
MRGWRCGLRGLLVLVMCFGLGGDDVFIVICFYVMGFGMGWLVCWCLWVLMDDEPESLILAQSERWRNA